MQGRDEADVVAILHLVCHFSLEFPVCIVDQHEDSWSSLEFWVFRLMSASKAMHKSVKEDLHVAVTFDEHLRALHDEILENEAEEVRHGSCLFR